VSKAREIQEHGGGSINNQNLKPFNTWPADELRVVSSKAGIASGKARRRRAFLREFLYELMELMTAQREQEELARKAAKKLRRQELNRERAKAKQGT
jgi:hypothetical protein